MISGGSGRWVSVALHDDTAAAVSHLRKRGFSIVAAHPSESARDYRRLDYTRKLAVLLGAELHGISDPAKYLVDDFVSIPMEGMVASLNVSVAAALILYEARRQREAARMYDESRLPPEVYEKTLFEWAHPGLARRCRDRGLPYPALSDDGELLENPFA